LTTTAELVDTNEKNAQAKEDIEDTKKSWSVGEEFLMMLKEKCSMPDEESEERQKTRQLEMEAVSKAWAVLSGDDAHDLFTRTFNPALLQVDLQDSRRAQAAKFLSDVAKRLQNQKLSNLAFCRWTSKIQEERKLPNFCQMLQRGFKTKNCQIWPTGFASMLSLV